MNFKILICGAGSIGERHIKNLLKLGYSDLIIYNKIYLDIVSDNI